MDRADLPGNRHAILGLRYVRWERAAETVRWVDRDMDKGRGMDRDRVVVDNKGKDNPQLAG